VNKILDPCLLTHGPVVGAFMEIKELKKFLASFKDSDLEELRLESDESKIFFKRDVSAGLEAVAAKVAVQEPKKETKPEKKYEPLRSTMVGTFFHAEKADHPPIVMEGNHVTIGQKVGVIEAMKVQKSVESHVQGKIVKALVKNGQPVEYGQELFLVDTQDVK